MLVPWTSTSYIIVNIGAMLDKNCMSEEDKECIPRKRRSKALIAANWANSVTRDIAEKTMKIKWARQTRCTPAVERAHVIYKILNEFNISA